MVDFPWRVYQENLMLIGMQGTGKTTMGTRILGQIPNVPRIIVSPINQAAWRPFGAPTDDLNALGRGAHLWTGPTDAATFDKLCTVIMDRIPNVLFVIDDLQEFVKKQSIPAPFNTLVQSGRNRGICSMWLTPAPSLISNYILQSSQHIFAFKMNLESQIEWVERNFFGPDAWLLLPPERRRKRPVIAEMDVFPKYAYLYRYYGHDYNQLSVPPGDGGDP